MGKSAKFVANLPVCARPAWQVGGGGGNVSGLFSLIVRKISENGHSQILIPSPPSILESFAPEQRKKREIERNLPHIPDDLTGNQSAQAHVPNVKWQTSGSTNVEKDKASPLFDLLLFH